MKCVQVERLIEEYSDGELNCEKVLEIEAHLSGCMNCSRLLESLRREDKMYENFGKNLEKSLETPPSMWDRICHGLDAEPRVESRPAGKDYAGWISVFSNMFTHATVARQILFASILVVISIGGTLLVVHRHDGTKVTTANREQRRDLQYALLSIEKGRKSTFKRSRF